MFTLVKEYTNYLLSACFIESSMQLNEKVTFDIRTKQFFICWYSVFGLILVTTLIAILVTSSCLSASVFADTILVQII